MDGSRERAVLCKETSLSGRSWFSERPPVRHDTFDNGTMIKVNPGQFIREVRREVSKVTWPTRKETTVTTGMVFLMVFLAAMFFLAIDQILSGAVRLILDLVG